MKQTQYNKLSPNMRTTTRAILKRLDISYKLGYVKIKRCDNREVTIKVAQITIGHMKEALKREKALVGTSGYYYTRVNSVNNIKRIIKMMEDK